MVTRERPAVFAGCWGLAACELVWTVSAVLNSFTSERAPYIAALGTTQHSLTGTDRQRQTKLVLISRLLYKVIVVLDDTHKTQLIHSYIRVPLNCLLSTVSAVCPAQALLCWCEGLHKMLMLCLLR